MLGALESVLSVLLTIALGFALAKRRWFEGSSSALISRIVVSVALPAYMINNLMGSYDRGKLVSMLPGLAIPFLTMIVGFALASGLAVLLRVPIGRRGTFASMFSLSNAVFIGLPVNILLFGDESLPYVLLYYIANTTCFWTIGTFGIASDGALRSGRPKPAFFSLANLRRLLSPPLVAFLAAVAMIMAGISLPKAVMDCCKYLGNMTTPLSMLFIGIVIERVDWKKLRFGADILFVVVGRFPRHAGHHLSPASRAEFPSADETGFFHPGGHAGHDPDAHPGGGLWRRLRIRRHWHLAHDGAEHDHDPRRDGNRRLSLLGARPRGLQTAHGAANSWRGRRTPPRPAYPPGAVYKSRARGSSFLRLSTRSSPRLGSRMPTARRLETARESWR